MDLFSQREGFKPYKTTIQIDFIDDELRNRLWNAIFEFYWNQVPTIGRGIYRTYDLTLFENIWNNFFKKPIDTMGDFKSIYKEVREFFYSCEWVKVYDFIEFLAQCDASGKKIENKEFMNYCNKILEEEVSAYRFINGKITQISNEIEIKEIENALKSPFKPIQTHLRQALELFSDRKNPDYRNSIKESISAVEAICRLIVKDDKATLGNALEKVNIIHPALKEGFKKIYGYTSDSEGIRHALPDESHISSEDAKFMLVACSAFINYLIEKSRKIDIKI